MGTPHLQVAARRALLGVVFTLNVLFRACAPVLCRSWTVAAAVLMQACIHQENDSVTSSAK